MLPSFFVIKSNTYSFCLNVNAFGIFNKTYFLIFWCQLSMFITWSIRYAHPLVFYIFIKLFVSYKLLLGMSQREFLAKLYSYINLARNPNKVFTTMSLCFPEKFWFYGITKYQKKQLNLRWNVHCQTNVNNAAEYENLICIF